MTCGFKKQFIPYTLDESKHHTIRAGQRWRAGMTIHAFANVRTATMRLLFTAPVVKVDRIDLLDIGDAIGVFINGEKLAQDEADAFLWRDGFRERGSQPTAQAFEFWSDALPFTGQLIHWGKIKRPRRNRRRSEPGMFTQKERRD